MKILFAVKMSRTVQYLQTCGESGFIKTKALYEQFFAFEF